MDTKTIQVLKAIAQLQENARMALECLADNPDHPEWAERYIEDRDDLVYKTLHADD